MSTALADRQPPAGANPQGQIIRYGIVSAAGGVEIKWAAGILIGPLNSIEQDALLAQVDPKGEAMFGQQAACGRVVYQYDDAQVDVPVGMSHL